MKVTLIKSGGLVGKKLSASADWTFTDSDWEELINAIKRTEEKGKKKDSFHYSLQQDNDESSRVPVNIQWVPVKFTALFKELFEGMKAE